MSKKDKSIEKFIESTEVVLPNSVMPVKEGAKDEKGNLIKPVSAPDYDAKRDIKKFGLKPTELLKYKDPFTGQMKSIVIDRRGTSDEKLALTLLDDKISREQKDSIISMYLWEQGKQGSSMLMDLWAYKGEHTKESRQFQSTMRYDFEMFLHTFQMFMQDSADLILNKLPIELVDVEKKIDGKKVIQKIPQLVQGVRADEIAVVLGDIAQYFRMTSDLLGQRMKAEVEKRERAKGKGVYIGTDNKPYSIYEDNDIVDVVKKDREKAVKEKND